MKGVERAHLPKTVHYLNDFIDLAVCRAKQKILELRYSSLNLKTEVDLVQTSTDEMIELIEREATIIGKWKNDAEILNMKDLSNFGKLEGYYNSDVGESYYLSLESLKKSAKKYLKQSYALAPSKAKGISRITMSSHTDYNCGGFGIRIRIHNPEGEECVTSRIPEFDAGNLLYWNNPRGGNCTDMEIRTWKTKVYIESNSGDNFCPKLVTIYTNGANYTTKEIDSWYDESTNLLPHRIRRFK